jgi:hypothetical protein
MAYELRLEEGIRKAGWKVKIRDKEILESPHVTIFSKSRVWRLCLRTGEFLDAGDSWRQIDSQVRRAVTENWQSICDAWDELYPENPVQSANDDEDDGE